MLFSFWWLLDCLFVCCLKLVLLFEVAWLDLIVVLIVVVGLVCMLWVGLLAYFGFAY